jgi:exosome complex component RRP43
MLDKKQLCIEEGKFVWMLKADIVCLDHDGNVTDAALIALALALRTLKVPVPIVRDDGEVTVGPGSTSLAVSVVPVPLTVCVLDGGVVLADCTWEEEQHAEATVTVVLTNTGQVR